MDTMAIQLLHGRPRELAPNGATMGLVVPRAPRDLGPLFVAAYPDFAGVVRAIDEPTLVLVAVDGARGRVAGILRLAARPGRVLGAVIGRHGCADLYLDGDEGLSLRQLAVLVEPSVSFARGSAELGYRLVDLRTAGGFTDEAGRRLAGVRCQGTAFFRCGAYALFAIAAGDPSDWPERGEDAWAQIPERVFFDERPPRARAFAHGTVDAPRVSGSVTATLAPRWSWELDDGGPPAGVLELERGRLRVSAAALREGVLLGRYDRCNGAELIADLAVSRTHLLVVDAGGGRICALDTGSTNGTLHAGRPVRLVELVDGMTLQLGYDTRVTWRTGG